MARMILIPLDGSEFGERAIDPAIEIAERTGGVIELVGVHRLSSMEPIAVEPTLSRRMREQLRTYLRAAAARIHEERGISSGFALLGGEPASAICRHAERIGASLIVVASHGAGGPSRSWIGSVTDRIVRWAGSPVLVIRSPLRPRRAATPSVPARTVLVPLDGSRAAEQVLSHAHTCCATDATHFVLIRVVSPPVDLHGVVWDLDRRRVEEATDRAEAYLHDVAVRRLDAMSGVTLRVVAHDSPAVAVLETAAAVNADLIAMTTHGRSGLSRLVLGSVADKVLRGTEVPLLLVRPGAGPRPRQLRPRKRFHVYRGFPS